MPVEEKIFFNLKENFIINWIMIRRVPVLQCCKQNTSSYRDVDVNILLIFSGITSLHYLEAFHSVHCYYYYYYCYYYYYYCYLLKLSFHSVAVLLTQ